jgi:hypothetical protein
VIEETDVRSDAGARMYSNGPFITAGQSHTYVIETSHQKAVPTSANYEKKRKKRKIILRTPHHACMHPTISQLRRLLTIALQGGCIVVVVSQSSMRSCTPAQRRTPMHASQVLRLDRPKLFLVSVLFTRTPTPLSNQMIYKARPKAARIPTARRPVP